MNHDAFHTLVSAVTKADDAAALAQIVIAGDELYRTQDWSEWGEVDNRVYGMLWAARLGGCTSYLDIAKKMPRLYALLNALSATQAVNLDHTIKTVFK